ncbi:MAG: hypothetical protein ACK5RG_22500 [Cyclobacteriaceae bacterium]|jgi:hypothetical protein|nr:hypothetical protein [Flammeovirgaceae bacterium]
MKTIKSALLGTKSLIDTNEEVLIVQLKDILKQHRELIINRLLGDLITYLDYKFQTKPDKQMMDLIKDKLIALKKSNVSMEYYQSIEKQVMNRAVIHLTNEPFYVEIDACVGEIVVAKKKMFS